MKSCKYFLRLLISLTLVVGHAQTKAQEGTDANSLSITDWLAGLSEPGVSFDENGLVLNAEAERLLRDPVYREEMYPETYTWEKALEFISRQELGKAFWYMINLYRVNDENKEMVLKSVLTYDRLFQMEKVLVNSFYTYIYMDHESSEFVNGVPVVRAPDIMEAKLNTLKDIIYLLEKYRQHSGYTFNNG